MDASAREKQFHTHSLEVPAHAHVPQKITRLIKQKLTKVKTYDLIYNHKKGAYTTYTLQKCSPSGPLSELRSVCEERMTNEEDRVLNQLTISLSYLAHSLYLLAHDAFGMTIMVSTSILMWITYAGLDIP